MVTDLPDAGRPTHRIRVRPDGRCAIRAALRAADVAAEIFASSASASSSKNIFADLSFDNSEAARSHLRDVRIDALRALHIKMHHDEDLDCAVRGSFPDEDFASFEAWHEAQHATLSHLGGRQIN